MTESRLTTAVLLCVLVVWAGLRGIPAMLAFGLQSTPYLIGCIALFVLALVFNRLAKLEERRGDS